MSCPKYILLKNVNGRNKILKRSEIRAFSGKDGVNSTIFTSKKIYVIKDALKDIERELVLNRCLNFTLIIKKQAGLIK